MKAKTTLLTGALLGGLAVAAGAFGAHGLEGRLSPADLDTFEVAVRYQMYHALALVLCVALRAHGYRTTIAEFGFLWGTIVFSGSLYALVLLDVRWLGAITPIGGALLLIGWFRLAFASRSPLTN